MLLDTNLDVLQEQGAAVQNVVYLLEPCVILGLEMLVVRRMDIPNDVLGNLPHILAVEPELALGEALVALFV